MAASSFLQQGGCSIQGGCGFGNDIAGTSPNMSLAHSCFCTPRVGFYVRLRPDLPRSLLAIVLQFLAMDFA